MDLLDNAVDSLNEALAKYSQGKMGDVTSYKFCVLHLAHFLELVLKHYVALAHPLLIYKNPFAKNIDEESQTIGLQEAINFLKNEQKGLSEQFIKDLLWLRRLRNGIEHYRFDMEVEEVESSIGRLVQAFVEFDQAHANIGLDDLIDSGQYDLLLQLADNYKLNLKKAENEVRIARWSRRKDPDFHVYQCDECGHETLISHEESDTGYLCVFCGNEESDFIEVPCGICEVPWIKILMRHMPWGADDDWIYVCPNCSPDPKFMNDD